MRDSVSSPWKLKLIALLILSAMSADSIAADDYSFSDGFIRGRHIKTDFSKYTSTGISEGKYSLDVYTNGEWKGRYDLNVAKQSDGSVGICYDADMLKKFGLSTERLNASLAKEDAFCGTLKSWNSDENVGDKIDKGALRLDISAPQIYQDFKYKGYVDPSMWDTGIPAVNIGWNGNVWNGHYSAANSSDSTSGYLGINAAASFGGWMLKHNGNLSWSDKNPVAWQSNRTYLERPIATISSLLSIGQISSSGEFFDTVTVRGVSLKTNDAMYPDGLRSFAPEIRGTARTNALVTIRQNGNVIHQTTVPPGPFAISDFNPSGYSSNLEVSVKESDGSVSYFSVPYSSVVKLLRPGMFRYEITAGKPDNGFVKNKPIVYQATSQYGLNNILTGYAGVSGYNDYTAFIVGAGINTPVGGFSVDVTESNFKDKGVSEKGKMYRATYSKSFEDTSISISASKRADKGFYTLNEALHYNSAWERIDEQSRVNIVINQKLPGGWGSMYANTSYVNYWGDVKKDTQYQIGYSNSYGRLYYNISAQRTKYSGGNDDRISLNFSLPLNFEGGHTSSITSSTNINNSRYSNTQVGISGSFGDNHKYTYGINTSVGDNKVVSLNAGYKSSWATLNGSYSQSDSYRQTSFSGSGTMVLHGQGVTFSPDTGSTLGLIEAKGAKGAGIDSAAGVKVDSNGFAIVSTLRPYRINTVRVNPKGAAENVYFNETMKQTVPYQGSVVKLTFDTEVQDNLLFKGKLKNGRPFPFGTSVYNDQGVEIGTVSQGGTVFVRNASQANAHINVDDESCSFTLPKENGEVVCN